MNINPLINPLQKPTGAKTIGVSYHPFRDFSVGISHLVVELYRTIPDYYHLICIDLDNRP